MKNTIVYDRYVVAFIDVLGQKEAFKEKGKYIDRIPEYLNNHSEMNKKLYKAHKKTVEAIQDIRGLSETLFKGMVSQTNNPKVNVSPEKKGQYNKLRQLKLYSYHFSDSLVAYTPVSINSDYFASNISNSIYGLLFYCGTMMVLSFMGEKPVRGAVEIGLGTKIAKNEIYGPALYRAYEIESKIAQYPRIVIGESIVEYLNSTVKEKSFVPNQTMEDSNISKGIAKQCLRMMVQAPDGCTEIDYLGEEFIRIFSRSPEINYKEDFQNAFKFVEKEYLRFRKERNQLLASRYYMLCNYFNARKKYFS